MSLITPRDDLLHAAPNDHYTWTETNWFGLMSVPEAGLQFDTYVWLHPTLKVAYAGLYISSGIKRDQLAADYWDYRTWLPMPHGNLDDFTLDNGLSIKILEPLTRYRIDYVDEARRASVHVVWDAIMPPVPFPMGEHLEQAGRVRGSLELEGKTYPVDCYAIRDHSWVFRPEAPKMGRRPISMVNCGFGDDLAFSLTVPDLNYGIAQATLEAPGWLTQASVQNAGTVPFCWLHKNGKTLQITAAASRTFRGEDGFLPVRVEAEFTDTDGERFEVTGKIVNFLPFHWTQNNLINCCLTSFTCNGRPGWGAYYESLEGDVVRKLMK